MELRVFRKADGAFEVRRFLFYVCGPLIHTRVFPDNCSLRLKAARLLLSMVGLEMPGEESLALLTDFLSRQELIPTFAEIENWTPYSVPCIIKLLVGDALS